MKTLFEYPRVLNKSDENYPKERVRHLPVKEYENHVLLFEVLRLKDLAKRHGEWARGEESKN